MSEREYKTQIKGTDLPEKQQNEIIEYVVEIYANLKNKPSDIASNIKGKLDEEYGGPWHVVVGKSFVSSISHEKAGFIYFYVENYAILCFKTA